MHASTRRILAWAPSAMRQFSAAPGSAVGLLGVGKMGAAMARNFIEAGYTVHAYDVSEEGRSQATAAGCIVGGSAAEVAGATDLTITMLPNDKVLEAVVEEILPALRPDSVHASCSTVSPHTACAQKQAAPLRPQLLHRVPSRSPTPLPI